GLETVDADKLESVLQTQETALIVLKAYLRRDVLERDLVEAERWLAAEGYTDAKVTLEELRFDDDRDEATVVLRVVEGPRYSVAAVRVEGAKETSPEDLRSDVRMTAGDPLRLADVERDRRRILERLGG